MKKNGMISVESARHWLAKVLKNMVHDCNFYVDHVDTSDKVHIDAVRDLIIDTAKQTSEVVSYAYFIDAITKREMILLKDWIESRKKQCLHRL